MSHAMFPGIVLVWIIGMPLGIGAFIVGLSCAIATGYLKDNSIIKKDTIIGIVFSGIFVDRKCRSCGIGKHLLEYVKQTHSTLSLGVYQKNKRAVSFYLREGFSILSEELDEATGEPFFNG